MEAFKRRSGLINFESHTFYTRSLDQRPIAVDLGANVGKFACAVATELHLTCYALEAILSIFRRIPNVPQVKKYNLAISNRDGPIQLFVSENPEANSIDHSIAASHGLSGMETCSGITLQQFLNNEVSTKLTSSRWTLRDRKTCYSIRHPIIPCEEFIRSPSNFMISFLAASVRTRPRAYREDSSH